MMERVVISLMILMVLYVCAAADASSMEADSTGAVTVRRLEARIDSLSGKLRELEEQKRGRRRGRGKPPLSAEEWIALLEEKDRGVERADMRRRSRRKWVDALLEAITERPGELRLNGGSNAMIQYSSAVGRDYTSGVGSFDIYAHTAFGPNSLLFFDLEAVGGNGPGEYFRTLSGLNGDAGSTQDEDGTDRLSVREAWYEFNLLGDIFTLTAGKIDLTNYFDNNAAANDETTQFISSAFVNSSALAVPGNSPGVRIRTTIAGRIHLQAGFSSAYNSGKYLLRDIFRIAGIGFTYMPDSDFESNFRFYGYQHPTAGESYGWGISFDNVAFGAFNIFGRYGINGEELADYRGIESAWSAGARLVRQIAGRTAILGIAAGENIPAASYLNNERIMEIYSRYRLNRWICVSPHLQMLWNAGGSSERLTIFGVRSHFNF
jgi:hypothetical protein